MAEDRDLPRRTRARDLDDEELVGPRRRARGPVQGDDEAPHPPRARRRPREEAPDDDELVGARRLEAPRLRRSPRRPGAGDGDIRDTLRGVVRDVPHFLKLLGRLARDPRVSPVDKGIVVAVLAYMVMPVDVIPDFLGPVIGQIDDFYLLALALSRLLNNAGIELLLEHWDGDVSTLETVLTLLDRAGSVLPDRVRMLLGRRG